MEEDNDDQWLYGEESAIENTSVNEKANDTSNIESFPTEPAQENTVDQHELEPPIIKPPSTVAFDDADVVPGEEELMVPLNPPVISAPETIEPLPENTNENNELVNGEATDGQPPADGENAAEKSDGEDEDEDDDNVNVVIGDIHQKSSTSYTAPSNLHIKRGNLLTLTKAYHYKSTYYQQQQLQQQGKFATDDFETVGVISGVAAHEFNLDNLEDKPWRKPGADITDYFNYGFNEETWRAYCERQKRMRVHESGSGLIPMNQTTNNVNIIPNMSVPPPNIMPPMGMNNVSDMGSGSINVIGGMNTRRSDNFAKENTIQVMTADRREYSKKNFTPDMSVPPPVMPPAFGAHPPGIPPPFPPMNQYGPPPAEYFPVPPEMDPYFHPYEPPQDPTWGAQQNWNANIDVKTMIPLSNGSGPPRPVNGTPELKPSTSDNTVPPGVKVKTEPEDRETTQERERERDRDKSREYDRDRDSRHRSHRHRSRSRSHERRSRKHKSRSRSPSYRSHKKKKSKKSERSKSDSE